MLGAGLGIWGDLGGKSVASTLAGLSARSQIAGRDGSVACTRATSRRCVFTGAVLPNNTACYGTFGIPGLGATRFYLAEPASTNREFYSDFRASDWLGSGSVKSTNGLYARFTEDGSNSSHRTTSSTLITPVGSSAYTLSFIVGPETTAPYVTVTVGTAWNATRVVAYAALATGIVTGGGGVTGSVFRLKDGSKLLSFTFTTIASPTANNIPVGMSLTGSEIYTGVGNFIDIKDVCLEAGSIAGARVDSSGSATTHNADLIEWTPTTPLGSTCALWGIYIPFAWDAAANTNMPGGAIPRTFEANADTVRFFTQTNFVFNRTDASVVNQTSSGSVLEARYHGIGSSFAATTSGAYLMAYHGLASGVSSAAGSTPYPGMSVLRLGNRTGSTDRAIRGVICLGASDSLTSPEITALHTVAKSLPNLFLP